MTETDTTRDNDYVAICEELQVIDAAIAAIDAGEYATDDEVEATFARFQSRPD